MQGDTDASHIPRRQVGAIVGSLAAVTLPRPQCASVLATRSPLSSTLSLDGITRRAGLEHAIAQGVDCIERLTRRLVLTDKRPLVTLSAIGLDDAITHTVLPCHNR